jgi:hypothetical protein
MRSAASRVEGESARENMFLPVERALIPTRERKTVACSTRSHRNLFFLIYVYLNHVLFFLYRIVFIALLKVRCFALAI